MSILQAIVLGLVQGLGEFLPISSSAHLIIVPWLLGWPAPGLAFDAALHLGTLAAVLIYFWRDLLGMVKALPRALRRPVATLHSESDTDGRLALLLAIGTVPGVVIGLIGASAIDEFYQGGGVTTNRAIIFIAVAMIALAIALWIAERVARHLRPIKSATTTDALVIGTAQALALIPGVSRSGATITAGLFRNFQRADAARFSFLLGVPIIAVAGLKGLLELVQTGVPASELSAMLIGILVSGVSGFLAIWWLLRYLQHASTAVFIAYRIIVGLLLIAMVVGGVR